MSSKSQGQSDIKIEQDMKVIIEIERFSGTKEEMERLSLNTYVEYVFPDGCFLIRAPIYKGKYYTFSQFKSFLLYVFINSRMFSVTVNFLKYIKQDRMLFAKLQPISDIVPNQRRDCYRLPMSKAPISAILPSLGDEEPLTLFKGLMLDLSDGGAAFIGGASFLIDVPVEKGEIFTLTFQIEEEEIVVDAEILNVGKSEVEGYGYKASAKFLHHDKALKQRIYQFIMKQQLEIRSKLGENTDLI